MITKQDRQFARQLVQATFGHHQYPGGIYPSDRRVNELLLSNDFPVPDEFGMRHVVTLFERLKITVSNAYARKFRDEAIMTKMGAAQVAARANVVPRSVTVAEIAARIEADCVEFQAAQKEG